MATTVLPADPMKGLPKKKIVETVLSGFSKSLTELFYVLERTGSHYIRCLVPNSQMVNINSIETILQGKGIQFFLIGYQQSATLFLILLLSDFFNLFSYAGFFVVVQRPQYFDRPKIMAQLEACGVLSYERFILLLFQLFLYVQLF